MSVLRYPLPQLGKVLSSLQFYFLGAVRRGECMMGHLKSAKGEQSWGVPEFGTKPGMEYHPPPGLGGKGGRYTISVSIGIR